MPKFNLKDLMSERSTKEIQTKERQEIVFRNPKELIPSDENFYRVENVDTLKQSLLLVGVLQPLLIENTDAGDIVIAGHRRRKACIELIREGHEEFKSVPCIYKTQTQTKELSGKEDILRQIALIQANNYRDKSDWERMTESLQMEELVKELRKEIDLEGKTRDILKGMINVSSGQMARYHAINANLDGWLMERFEKGAINVSVAYEASTLDAKRQQEAREILEKTGTLALGDVQGLKTLMNTDIPGQMTVEDILPEFIQAETQIERFYESLKKNLKQRIKDRDQNMVSYLLYTFYGDIKIQNRFLNYRGSREGIIFNPGQEETVIPWKEFAEQLISKYGKKPKPVKTIPVDAPDQGTKENEQQKKGLKKPDEEEREYLESAARMNAPQKETEISELPDSEIPQIAPAQTDVWPEDIADIPIPSPVAISDYLEEEERTLKDCLECEGLPERTVLRQQLKVAGLRMIRNLVKDVMETEEEVQQPELPKLKNNEERKEWLRNYKTWPLRHTDAYTGARYYEFRFENGAVLVAEEWKHEGNEFRSEFETAYMHLIGAPEPPKGFNGVGKWNTHKTFNRYPESETELVEFLKEIQKDGK